LTKGSSSFNTGFISSIGLGGFFYAGRI
jgi:hypothetical protein